MAEAKVLVFDANETLLDFRVLDEVFREVYGDALARERWFKQALSLSLVATVLDDYRPFDELAGTARMAVLTNSTKRTMDAQMEHAQIAHYFDAILSVDAVRRYKPARETYEYAANELGVAIHELALVAAHAWDVRGAQHAGAHGAFIRRPGEALGRGKKPDIVASDLLAFAAQWTR
jgi:2-haloacid dehalogenase